MAGDAARSSTAALQRLMEDLDAVNAFKGPPTPSPSAADRCLQRLAEEARSPRPPTAWPTPAAPKAAEPTALGGSAYGGRGRTGPRPSTAATAVRAMKAEPATAVRATKAEPAMKAEPAGWTWAKEQEEEDDEAACEPASKRARASSATPRSSDEWFEDAKAEFEAAAERKGAHPWAVRPDAVGKSTDLTEEERAALRTEAEFARLSNTKWQDRGPVQTYTEDGQPEVKNWRGQTWRTGSQGGAQRFSNRGGRYRDYYKDLNKRGLLKPTPKGATVVKAPRDEEKWGSSGWHEI